MSRDVQKSFRADVRPILEEPARAYFFGVPEFTNGIIVFSTGLPECFSLLGKKGDFDYFTSAGRGLPRVELPKRATLERRATNYYLFDWNPLTGHFRQTGPSFRDSQPFRPGTNILVSWNFSKRSDISQWRLTDGQLIPSDENVQPYTFVTRSANSLLKSPRIGRRVKYVEITCRVTAPAKIPLSGQLSWMTTTDLVSDTKKAIVFPVNNDGSAHTYWLPLYINGWSLREPIAHLALRLSDHPATTIEVESVTLYSF
jgi:hypothetical protein